MTRWALLLTAGVVAVVVRVPALAQSAKPLAASERIEIGRLTDRATGQTDPLTQVVRIAEGNQWTTGTLLRFCRVFTALRPLIEMKTRPPRSRLNAGESLVGDRFTFETAPLASQGGKKAIGHFVVIAHGALTELNLEETLGDRYPADWALGYDEECLSDKLKLGTVRLVGPTALRDFTLPNSDFSAFSALHFVASYSAIRDADLTTTGAQLYVDAQCGINTDVDDEPRMVLQMTTHHASLETTCSLAQGGAGALLMRYSTANNLAAQNAGERVVFASGMFERALPKTVSNIPHVQHPWIVHPFTILRFMAQLQPYLDKPVNVEMLRKRDGSDPH